MNLGPFKPPTAAGPRAAGALTGSGRGNDSHGRRAMGPLVEHGPSRPVNHRSTNPGKRLRARSRPSGGRRKGPQRGENRLNPFRSGVSDAVEGTWLRFGLRLGRPPRRPANIAGSPVPVGPCAPSRPAVRALGSEPESRGPTPTPSVALAPPAATLADSHPLWLTPPACLTAGLLSGALHLSGPAIR